MSDQPHVLREYAVVADGERGAVIGPRGDVVWMCAPRWHDGAVFTALLGGRGVYRLAPAGRSVWGGWYEPRSLVWHSRWVTADGVVECREALSYPGDRDRLVLVRHVTAIDGPVTVEVELRPRADYDRTPMSDVTSGSGAWTFRCGALHGRWTCGPGARHHGDTLTLRFELAAGESRDLLLELAADPLPADPPDPGHHWRATEATWRDRVPDLSDGVLPSGRAVLAGPDTAHSLAVLHGLTGADGGMVAAVTAGLPERSRAGRNYDYRYVWLRDQCYAGHAALAAGDDRLLDSAVRFVTARLLDHGPDLAPAYTVDGSAVPAERHLGLPGYPGGADVVGNHAGAQFQLDVFGEALLLLAGAAARDRVDDDGWAAAELAADAVAQRWTQPDAGIWELDDRAWTHSRLIASAGLRALAAARPGPSGSRHLALADAIVADTTAHALDPAGHWCRAQDDPACDAALLLLPLRGALPPGDPRTAATLRAYLRELTIGGYAYRFRHDDRPLADAEGSFVLCGFLTALSLAEAKETEEARAWFERTRAATGPPVLYSEEYDARQHQMRGNLPQAFVHAFFVETAARLTDHDPNDRQE